MKQTATKTPENKKEISQFLEKIVINAGVGRLSSQPNFEEKTLKQVMSDLASMSGQKPQVRRAKKSIAGFKVREGSIVGVKITLRRKKMVDFFERLIKIILPRVRDFVGIDQENIDDCGALNLGLKEQFIFPEINPEKSPVAFSFGITLVPRNKNRARAVKTLLEFGVPLKKQSKNDKLKGKNV
jgi:large subunit ribosomal protein L5